MPLRTPVLDDRSYAQLRDELIARIPVYAPEWTDHHPSDPGITLIELFAFLGENLLFRFNQIPDATKMAFLDLLHVPMRSAVPAAGMVRFETGASDGIVVDRSSRVLAGDVPFQTLGETTVWPVSARAAIRATVDEDLDADTTEYLARTRDAIGALTASVRSYRTSFGAHDPTQAGGDVLDPRQSIDDTIYIALVSDAVDLTAMAAGLLSIGVVPRSDAPTMEERAETPCPGEGFQPPSPPMQWQICTTTPVSDPPRPDSADPVWRNVAVVGDTTSGMTQPGVVRLELPSDLSDIGVYVPDNPDAIGAGDQPPLVEDPEIDAQLVTWLRVFRPDGGGLAPIEWLDTNSVGVEQAISARAEFLGTGTGEATQERNLVHADVLGTVELDVEELGAGRWVPWVQVEDFRASSVDDRHFSVDREAGIVRCGDGRRGRPWQIGERIRVRHYRYGGGVDGNVGPGAITKAAGVPGVEVTNALAMRGGVDAEPLTDAIGRIPEEFRRHDRAVTASDFRELALETPGAGVARAETLPLFDPLSPSEVAAGVVSVVVFPERDPKHPSAPRPERPALDAVCRWLDARRLVTTELHVIPPTYRRIAVSVGVSVKPGYGIESVRRWVELVLRQYLAPLPPFGPDGGGWPLGRRIFAPELEAAALQVEGVEFLEPGQIPGSPCLLGLRLAEEDGSGEWIEPDSRSVSLEKWEVPELAEITVVEGPAMEPGLDLEPPVPDGPPVPVRAPREVC
ncbi:MAG: putative baseplate assembly protein [Acidimicrobiia bacterium]|nr:putative baseplate assembly protein [Acidimicrobiia bacterium]